MTAPFTSHRDAALDLLLNAKLSHREAGFLGHVTVAEELSEKQRSWIVKILARKERPPLQDGVQ